MEPTLKDVIEILKEKGWSDEQIIQLTTQVTKTSFAGLYEEAIASFTDEDLKTIEACSNQEETAEEIKQLYSLRTGKNAEEEARKFVANFCQEFMVQYRKDNPS